MPFGTLVVFFKSTTITDNLLFGELNLYLTTSTNVMYTIDEVNRNDQMFERHLTNLL